MTRRLFRLTSRQRQQLRALMKTAVQARTYRRALALLERDRGTPVEQVAAMLGLHRATVSAWCQRYQRLQHPEALTDRPGRGRRRLLTPECLRVLHEALQYKPDQLGYMATEWTVPLLLEHLLRLTQVRVSDDTLRRQLHRMRYRFKRPRYVLVPDAEQEYITPRAEAAASDSSPLGRAGGGRNRSALVSAAAGRLVAAG